MLAGLTKEEQRATFARLRSFLAAGDTDEIIAVDMGLSWEEYEELKRKFYAHESDILHSRSTEEVYIDYVLDQKHNIRDLDALIPQFRSSKQGSAVVGAIRARSEIVDKILEKGQDFGFIERKSEPKIIAGIMVQQMSTGDLRTAIAKELGELSQLTNIAGDLNIIDVPVGPLHTDYVEPPALSLPAPSQAVAAPAGKAKAHTRNKVHGGRRVVKRKKKE